MRMETAFERGGQRCDRQRRTVRLRLPERCATNDEGGRRATSRLEDSGQRRVGRRSERARCGGGSMHAAVTDRLENGGCKETTTEMKRGNNWSVADVQFLPKRNIQ